MRTARQSAAKVQKIGAPRSDKRPVVFPGGPQSSSRLRQHAVNGQPRRAFRGTSKRAHPRAEQPTSADDHTMEKPLEQSLSHSFLIEATPAGCEGAIGLGISIQGSKRLDRSKFAARDSGEESFVRRRLRIPSRADKRHHRGHGGAINSQPA